MPAIQFFLSGVCHQWPDHCLWYQGQPLPLCARCMGTFLGVAIGLVVLMVMGRSRRNRLPAVRPRVALGLLALSWGVDGVNSALDYLGMLSLYTASNTGRLLTGLGFGVVIATVLQPIYQSSMWKEGDERPALERVTDLAPLLAAVIGGAVIILVWRSAPWALWVIATTMAVALALSMTNATLIALLLRKEGFASCWITIIPFWVAGLIAALIETGAMATVRWLLMNQK